jgi:hypothetical protein
MMYEHEDEDRAVREELFAGGYPEPSPEELAEMLREAEALDAAYRADDLARAAAARAFREPAAALAFLVDLHGGDDCEGECPAPVEVLEVLSCNDGSAMRAVVRCADGTTRTVEASIHYSRGSWECPPDVDVSYEYL